MHRRGGGYNVANVLIRDNAPSKFRTQNLYENQTFHEKNLIVFIICV